MAGPSGPGRIAGHRGCGVNIRTSTFEIRTSSVQYSAFDISLLPGTKTPNAECGTGGIAKCELRSANETGVQGCRAPPRKILNIRHSKFVLHRFSILHSTFHCCLVLKRRTPNVEQAELRSANCEVRMKLGCKGAERRQRKSSIFIAYPRPCVKHRLRKPEAQQLTPPVFKFPRKLVLFPEPSLVYNSVYVNNQDSRCG